MKGGTIRVAVVRFLFVLATFMVLSGWTFELLAFSEDESAGESLTGLEGIAVLVMPINPDAELNGLKRDQIHTDIEMKIRKAGIKILTDREMHMPGFPYLNVTVTVAKGKNPEPYNYDIKMAMYKQIALNPDDILENPGFGLYFPAEAWSTKLTGTASASDLKNNVQKQVDDALDKFIKAFLEANPKNGDKP